MEAEHTLTASAPVDFATALTWFDHRQLRGIDEVHDGVYTVALSLPSGTGTVSLWQPAGEASSVRARLRLADAADEEAAVGAARRLLDLDADLATIDARLAEEPWLARAVEQRPGARIPRVPGLTEVLLRAVTGQQIHVQRGRALLQAMADAVRTERGASGARPGTAALEPFPTAAEALATLDSWFKGPGARRETLRTMLSLLSERDVPDSPGDSEALLEEVAGLKGIGPWTLGYARLRGLGDPDADLSGDGALASRARKLGLAQDRKELTGLLDSAAPFRSYAALHLWDTPAAAFAATRT